MVASGTSPSPTRRVQAVIAGLGAAAVLIGLAMLPIRLSRWAADGPVVVEFHHPAAVSTARIRLVDGSGPVTLRERYGGFVRRPENGRIVVEVDGRPDHFDLDIPRSAAHVELHVSDRTLFRREGAAIVTIWPADADSTWLIPLTP
jgi:hypothetical protein